MKKRRERLKRRRDRARLTWIDKVINKSEELLYFSLPFLNRRLRRPDFPYKKVIRKGRGIPMKEEFRNFLREMCYDEIEDLYERFGAKVAHWRYPRPKSMAGTGT